MNIRSVNSDIVVICYDEIIEEKAKAAMRQNNWNYPVAVCLPEECAALAAEYEKTGTRTIITFGMFAKQIRQQVKIPVITIDVSFTNIAQALVEASALGTRVAMVGFQNVLRDVLAIRSLLKIELITLPTVLPPEMPAAIASLRKKQVDVVVGGPYQVSLAERYGMKAVLIENQVADIVNAVQNAEAFLKQIPQGDVSQISMELMRVGTVTVDVGGRVVMMNLIAAKCLGVSQKNASEFNIYDICPGMMSDIHNAIHENRVSVNRIASVGDQILLYSVMPLKSQNNCYGALISIQDAKDIQQAESKIRQRTMLRENKAVMTFDQVRGTSRAMQQCVAKAFKYAATEQTVLITGESGTGKEVFAQSIHMASRRKEAPFIAINCAALPENILESELFGYVKGAFTGAAKEGKQGLFEAAHTGTIFLDEIGEISLGMQGKLLRVLQERTIRRLGDSKVIPVDIRVITATNKNLVEMVRGGSFREDLYFRINVLCLSLPPLREREGDMLLMADAMLEDLNLMQKRSFYFSPAAKEEIRNYSWPGNVRELQNMVSRVCVLCESEEISAELVRDYIQENYALFRAGANVAAAESLDAVSEVRTIPGGEFTPARRGITREELADALRKCGGSRNEAAELLGISRATLYRRLKEFQ